MLRARSSRFRFSTSAAVLAIADPPLDALSRKSRPGLTSLSGSLRSELGHQRVPELDRLGRARARLADRNHAVLRKRHFLVVDHDLPAVRDGDVGAVTAVVAQDEVAPAMLDRAVLAR